jgi:hypothetical protein
MSTLEQMPEAKRQVQAGYAALGVLVLTLLSGLWAYLWVH